MLAEIASGYFDAADVFFLVALVLFLLEALVLAVKVKGVNETLLRPVGLAALALALLLL